MVESNFLIAFLILEVASFLLTYKFYQAAGRKAWEAAIPIYKTYVMMGIIKRARWQTILFFIPVVSNVMAIVMVYELLHVFNFRKLKYTLYSVLTLGLYLGYLGFTEKLNYVGKDEQNIKKTVGELGTSIFFAVIAATVIRAFTFEAYTIPTSSMEKSLMVGDFLFVSKMHYGSRLPITPISVPLVHNTIPFFGTKSYSDLVQLPYIRLPKLESLDRMDPVVFNYPAQDIRAVGGMLEGVLPIDKRENYVKRCVAVAGDTLKIEQSKVLVNGELQIFPDRAEPQFMHIASSPTPLDLNQLKERYDINSSELNQGQDKQGNYLYQFPCTQEAAEGLRAQGVQITQFEFTEPAQMTVFPNGAHNQVFDWTIDNYGPLYIPAKGQSIELNRETYQTYKRVIEFYDSPEKRQLEERDGLYYLNGEAITSYTFQQDYYFMMGDNRHMSDDSRFWGFVPEDHIVGKPVFIWMSYDAEAVKGADRIRTERVFTTVSGDGERRSYFWPFVVVVVIGTIANRFYKKRKAKKAP